MAKKSSKKSISKSISKATKKVEKAVEKVVHENRSHWNNIEDFKVAVREQGLAEGTINVDAEWALYQENPSAYRNHLGLRSKLN